LQAGLGLAADVDFLIFSPFAGVRGVRVHDVFQFVTIFCSANFFSLADKLEEKKN
jgi:hypothetical protein